MLVVLAAAFAVSADPIGPSSRRTAWVISEVMYHPLERPDGTELEFIEIYNAGLIAEDLGGHRLSGELNYVFPPGTIVPAGGYVVVASSPSAMQAEYGITGVLGGWTTPLSNADGTIQLFNPAGALLLEVSYSDSAPWPAAADGAGHSLVLSRPSYGEGDPRAWSASARIGGSPGQPEPDPDQSWDGIFINEILANPEPSGRDFIEIHNRRREPVDLSGCRLTDNPVRTGLILPSETVLAPGGFLVLDESQLGFGLSSAGESVFLYSPDGTQVIDAIRFGPQPDGVSFGRHPDAAPDHAFLQQPTPGAPNAPVLPPAVIINEIMYNPVTGDDADEYIELHNPGSEAVNIGGWRLIDGITFEFPPGASIPPGGYVVVSKDAVRLRARHPQLTSQNTFGDFTGNLSNAGERVALARPQWTVTSDGGVVTSNLTYVVVNEVTYSDGGQWGHWADGGGSSLELRDPRSDNRRGANWADSDESDKATWTTIEWTGVLDHGTGSPDQLQLLAQGAGEYLVDDVEVSTATSGNLIANGRFNNGVGGWIMRGTQAGSTWEPSLGATSPGALRVRATARGDTGANRIETRIPSGINPGATATLRARVRWLRGHPEFLLRLRGNYLEAFGALDLPANLGTPGAPNSVAEADIGPAIWDLAHAPVLPAPNQPILITARIHDPDGVGNVRLRYRRDPAASIEELPMTDDGTGSDQAAADGVFTALLPGFPQGSLIAFQIRAEDASASPQETLFPSVEALIRVGESRPAGTLGTYRLWMTQETFDRWSSRSKLDNSPLPVTFVYNEERVVHGAGAYYAGSPHISPGYSTPSGNLCGYVVVFPEDEPFLGATEIVLDWPGRDTTAQQEPMAYWIARELGIPFNHRRFIRLHVNGVTETQRGSIYEDAQQVNSDLVESWNPGLPRGDLFKIEQWFEFSDSLSTSHVGPPRLENYTTAGGGKKLARYRWSWLKRAVQNSANNYTSLFTLVDAANASDPETYTRQLGAFTDMEEWMRVFATENIVVNFDAWGYDIGKNMYAYKPPGAPWQLYMWDIDWVMLASGQHGFTPQSPLMYRGPAVFGEGNRDPVVGRMYDHPEFQRAYWRAIEDAVNGPLLPERVAARMDATHAALVANGVTRSAGGSLSAPNAVKVWLAQRRQYLLSQLAGVSASFSIEPTPASVSGTNLLTIRGTAPVSVRRLLVNGRACPVTWDTLTHWSIRVPLEPGPNSFMLQGVDRSGNPLPNASAQITVEYADTVAEPEAALVINEIQYQPTRPGAEFVEIFNRSVNSAFDLSSWRIDGVGLTLPEGTLLEPGGFLLVSADRQAVAEAHGITPYVSAEFDATLRPDGETLTLLRPDPTSADRLLVVNSVHFDTVFPWPAPAPGSGASLQLIDPAMDNQRPANWTTATPPDSNEPAVLIPMNGVWRYRQDGINLGTAWREPAFDDQTWSEGGALLFNETASLPAAKVTPLTLGPTTFYLRTRFSFEGNPAAVALHLTTIIDDGAVIYLNGHEIFRIGMPAGSISASTFANRNTPDATLEGPFTIPATHLQDGVNVLAAEVHQVNATSSDIAFGLELVAVPNATLATPGAPNSVRTSLPPFPAVWINEIQPLNQNGPRDAFGDRDPWVELINTGTQVIQMDDLYLTDSTQLTRWNFPAGTTLAPGQLLVVWLDGEPAETTPTELHADFRLNSSAGMLALVEQIGASARVLDSVRYSVLLPGHVIALLPDGNPNHRVVLSTATAGAPNTGSATPLVVRINEWMADNDSAHADPADGDFEDWFELFNPGPTTADLTGYFLTDDPANPQKFAIPAGTSLPPNGFLIVWADEEGSQDVPGGDLHANFRLSQSGESIRLIAPDGTVVDAVEFQNAVTDVSQGRWPDGGPVAVGNLSRPTPGTPNAPPSGEESPRITEVILQPGNFIAIRWSVIPGAAYRLQATETPEIPSSWTDLTTQIVFEGNTAIASEAMNGSQRRFYRVRRVE